MEEAPLLIKREKRVVSLILNRPRKKNSLTPELVNVLLRTLEELAADDTVRVLVLRGAGDTAFCAGYDIGALPTGSGDDARQKLKSLNPVEDLFRAVLNFPFPVIALIQGVAFGAGCELAICCDIRIGSEESRMAMPPTKLGLVYPWRGLQRFIRTIGPGGTKEIFFSGRIYQGTRLKELGLVDYLVASEDIESFTFGMAAEIAANAPLALRGTKRAISLLMQSESFDETKAAEADSLTEASFLSRDLEEGRLAFLEKRKPRFRGE